MFLIVKATPKAKHNKIIQIDDTHFAIHTTAAPDQGKANQAIIKLLATHLDISPSRLKIVKGQTSKNKLIAIT